jgi:hypothetical protein
MAGSEIGKQMTKNLGGRILLKTGQSLLKGTGRVGGALAGGALQSNTIGAAKTYSDIANRNMGNLTLNDKGNLDFKDGEGIAEAFLKGQLNGDNCTLVIYGTDGTKSVFEGTFSNGTHVSGTISQFNKNGKLIASGSR